MKQSEVKYDFKTSEQTTKEARKARGASRNQLADKLDIASRYIAPIENSGQYPNLQIFYELVTFLDMSVGQFFFPMKTPDKTTQHRQFGGLLNGVGGTGLVIAADIVKGIQKAKEARRTREAGE